MAKRERWSLWRAVKRASRWFYEGGLPEELVPEPLPVIGFSLSPSSVGTGLYSCDGMAGKNPVYRLDGALPDDWNLAGGYRGF